MSRPTVVPLPFALPPGGAADDNDRFDERPQSNERVGSTPPATAGPAPLAAGETGCAVIGPSAAGKTSLLLALGRACLLPEPGDPDLIFVPDDTTAGLMKQAIRESLDARFRRRASRKPVTYGFHLRPAAPATRWRKAPFSPLKVAIHDGPGGALFPAEKIEGYTSEDVVRWQAQMFASAREASVLLFCVNAEHPQSDLWQTHLPGFIDQIAGHGVPLQRTLAADRVLILLTKVDRLCERVVRGEGSTAGRFVGGLERRPEMVARHLDPVEQARHLLGPSVLNLIRSALKRKAHLAVGVASAGGFNPRSGRSHWEPDGKPRQVAGESADDILRRWVPFGVRDAIFFVASGRCRGTVRGIRREDLLHDSGRVAALISSQKGDSR
jgi:hypothetical protein